MAERKMDLMNECCKEFWGKKANLMEESRDFFRKHGEAFIGCPVDPTHGEQNLEMYTLYKQYLKHFESSVEDYIDEKGVTPEEFTAALSYVQDHNIKDKKLKAFVKFLLVCTEYDHFYKVMVREGKKQAMRTADAKGSGGPSSGSKGGGGGSKSNYDSDDSADAKDSGGRSDAKGSK